MISDPVRQAQEQEASDRLPFIVPLTFWTDYEPQPDGSHKPIDWVTWVKKGTANPPTVDEKISRLSKRPNDIWTVIEPYYKKWKEGQTVPINGTPLAAWPGATPQLVKVLEPVNIRSVEDFAEMEDSQIVRLAIPGIRVKQQQAKAFLEAQRNTAGVAGEVHKLREENGGLRNELRELRELIASLAEEKGIDIIEQPAEAEPVQKKGGWPKGKPRKPVGEPN